MSDFEQFMKLSDDERLQIVDRTLENMQELSRTLKQQVMEQAKASDPILSEMQAILHDNRDQLKHVLQTMRNETA